MSLNESIDDHATGTYTVTRTAPGTWLRGRYIAGVTSTFPMTASVQDIESLVLQDAAGGYYSQGRKEILTTTELRTQKGEDPPDFVEIDGEVWRVDSVGDIEHWGETHYEVIVVRYALP